MQQSAAMDSQIAEVALEAVLKYKGNGIVRLESLKHLILLSKQM